MRKLTQKEREDTQELRIQRIKEAKKRYVENHPERRKESFTKYWKNKRDENPVEFKRNALEKYYEYKSQDTEGYLKKKRIYEQKYRSGNSESLIRRKEKARISLLAKYGLTQESFQKMLSDQEGKCAICKLIFGKKINIDHCHDTGRVRGLLCDSCNIVLGHIDKIKKVIPDIQEQFTKYLK